MSDRIKIPSRSGYVLKVENFDYFKKLFKSMNSYVRSFSIEIPDFDLNEFLATRNREEPKFSLGRYLFSTETIEKPLLALYYTYKRNPKDYNKLIEIEQKIDFSLFFAATGEERKQYPLFKLPDFDNLKKIWERYIPFPKLTNASLILFFLKIEKSPGDLERFLRRREIILSFLKPYFSYPIKEIPIEETTPEEIDNTDL